MGEARQSIPSQTGLSNLHFEVLVACSRGQHVASDGVVLMDILHFDRQNLKAFASFRTNCSTLELTAIRVGRDTCGDAYRRRNAVSGSLAVLVNNLNVPLLG